ncbi:MAG: PEGA domain-containing protein [Thermoguttaceae bacterium]
MIAASLAAGCVERQMTIRSDPPGALAYVDDHEIGITPITTPFLYYGERKIRLVKDGYETLTVMQNVSPPWYEIPPADFVSENMVPGKLRDQRTYDFRLQPQAVVPTDQLLNRAESLRRGVTGVPGAGPGPGPAGVRGQSLYALPPPQELGTGG